MVQMQQQLNGLRALPISADHIQALQELPPHHRDPFDRMLIAQARTEGMTLVAKLQLRDPSAEALLPDALRRQEWRGACAQVSATVSVTAKLPIPLTVFSTPKLRARREGRKWVGIFWSVRSYSSA
jgi:hypothetical protein